MELPDPIAVADLASFDVLSFMVTVDAVTCDVIVVDANGYSVGTFAIAASPTTMDGLLTGRPALEKLPYPNTAAMGALIGALATAASIPEAMAAAAQVLFDQGLFQSSPPEAE